MVNTDKAMRRVADKQKKARAERAKRKAAEKARDANKFLATNVRVPRYCVGVRTEGSDGGYYGDALTRFVCHDKESLVRSLEGYTLGVKATDDDLGGGMVFVLRSRKGEA